MINGIFMAIQLFTLIGIDVSVTMFINLVLAIFRAYELLSPSYLPNKPENRLPGLKVDLVQVFDFVSTLVLNYQEAMILWSGKVVSETSNNDEIKEEDIISNLHVPLLVKILSLLPDADANRTRILSKRWEDLWAFLPNLHFEMETNWSIEEVNKFYDAVDKTLTLRDGMAIQRFLLKCSEGCDYERVYDWFRKVVQCKVQEIDIDISFEFNSLETRSCWDLFKTCNTLVRLKLDGFRLDFPENELLFPCLKIIKLKSNVFSDEESFANLVSGCPVLEELFFESYLSDGVNTFKVSSSSLKRLSMSFCRVIHLNEKVVIDAPTLEYLYILDSYSTHFLTKPLSLIETHINIMPDAEYDAASELFTSLSSAKLLTLSSSTVEIMQVLQRSHVLNVPMFPNLVKLVIGIYCIDDWNFLLVLLNNTPNLEHLTFSDGLPRCKCCPLYNMSKEAPDCLRFKMKEIIIHHLVDARLDEITFIRYLLKHSYNMEKMTISSYTGVLFRDYYHDSKLQFVSD